MRLWLKDSERRPDPKPVATDDRKAVIAGLAILAIATAALLLLPAGITGGSGNAAYQTYFWTCIAALTLGAILLGYTHRRHVIAKRSQQTPEQN